MFGQYFIRHKLAIIQFTCRHNALPLSKQIRHAKHLATERAEEQAKRLGISRRNFLMSSCGAATTLLAMNDAGEEPLKGALLYAPHGKGDYVYCSLALYRQLRIGHVGAARILVNLLAR